MADVDELSVNYVFLAIVTPAVICTVWGRRLSARLRGTGFVHGFGELVAGSGQPVDRGGDAGRVIFPDGFLGLFEGRFDFLRDRLADLGCDAP